MNMSGMEDMVQAGRRKGQEVTLKQGRQSREGYSSISPVLILKQAPCQGQRSLSPFKTPAIEKPPTTER